MADPFPASESSVHANMTNMSYANSSPAATTAGQGSSPVSDSDTLLSAYALFWPIFMIFITSLSHAYLPLPQFISAPRWGLAPPDPCTSSLSSPSNLSQSYHRTSTPSHLICLFLDEHSVNPS